MADETRDDARWILAHLPLPERVATSVAAAADGARARALLTNPALPTQLFARLLTSQQLSQDAVTRIALSTPSSEQLETIARLDGRVEVVRALAARRLGRRALVAVADRGELYVRSARAAQILNHHVSAASDPGAVLLDHGEVGLWLVNRGALATTPLSVVTGALDGYHAPHRRRTRRSIGRRLLAGVLHDRGALLGLLLDETVRRPLPTTATEAAAPILHEGASRSDLGDLLAAAADGCDLGDPELEDRTELLALLEAEATRRLENPGVAAARLAVALANRAEVPVATRRRLRRQLRSHGSSDYCLLPLAVSLDWRRDHVTADQASALADTWDATISSDARWARSLRPTIGWQLLAALANPALDDGVRTALADAAHRGPLDEATCADAAELAHRTSVDASERARPIVAGRRWRFSASSPSLDPARDRRAYHRVEVTDDHRRTAARLLDGSRSPDRDLVHQALSSPVTDLAGAVRTTATGVLPAMLVEIAMRRLDDDPAAWSVLLATAGGWAGTWPELVEVAAVLQG